jgi:hypothetical protein
MITLSAKYKVVCSCLFNFKEDRQSENSEDNPDTPGYKERKNVK